ncbi:MAG: acyl-CoA synthetase [Sneathiella sp.]
MTDQNLSFDIRHHAVNQPDKIAFKIYPSSEGVTFQALEQRANQGAQLLRSSGLNVGDHMTILMENRREFLETCFAADRSGLYYTTISTHLTVEEIAYIIADCSARVVIISDSFSDIAQQLQDMVDPAIRLFMVGTSIGGTENWSAMLDTQPDTPISDEVQGLDMLYSSGTTGKPKGVKWPLTREAPGGRSMLITLLSSLFGYSAQTRYLCPAPLYHAAPLRHTMVTLKMGGSAFIMAKFDAQQSLKIIEQEQITHSQWVPTMFVRLLKLPSETRNAFDFSSMEMAVHAAAPCPISDKHQMIDWWGDIIHEYYAGTENNGFTAISTREWLQHEGSVGREKLGILHICDETGQEAPKGAEGEIFFENGHQFEYHNNPEKTADCTNDAGWTTLGDVGRVDDEGYLYLTDRKSYMIISGGVNIYPQETENILIGHPDVLDAAVIGVPNEDFGEEVKAVIQLAAEEKASSEMEAELIQYCRSKLSSIKCPRSIDFRKTLPRAPNGKLYKRNLRDEYW